MAARTSAAARREVRVGRLTSEEAARRALSGARPFLDEVLSLWPGDRRDRIVLWVRVEPAGNVEIVAHPREQRVAGAAPEIERDLGRIRDDVPVVLELHDGGTVVLPLRALREPL
jgi:hypothetical protein